MMTAEERVAPRIPGGGRTQEMGRSRAIIGADDPLFDAVDGAFISALLQHALDNLSATASTSKGEGKTEGLNSEPASTTLPPLWVCGGGHPRKRKSPAKTSRRCSTNLTTSRDCSSTFFIDRTKDDITQCHALNVPACAADADHTNAETRNTNIICLPEDGFTKAETAVGGAWLHNGSQSTFSKTGKMDVSAKNCIKYGSVAIAPNRTAARDFTFLSTSPKASLGTKSLCPKVAALLEFPGGGELEEIPAGSIGDASISLKPCREFSHLETADMTMVNAGTAANTAVNEGLLCSTLVPCHKPTRSTSSSTPVDNGSSEDASADAVRHVPFHILLSRLCGDSKPEMRLEDGGLQRHEEGASQKQSSKHQEDSGNASYTKIQSVPTAQPQTFAANLSPLLRRKSGPTFTDEGFAGTLQGLLVGRSRGASARNLCELPGALLQQQSVGRALLTRLASLQVQQALLRCTVTLPHSSPQATALYPKRMDERQRQLSHAEIDRLAEKDGQGPPFSQQLSHDKWPLSASSEERSTMFHSHLQHSELLSLMQNHTTCVFHFVIRALSLLANCCPLWAAAGNDVATGNAGANAAYNSVPENGEAPRTTISKLRTSREKDEFVAVEVQDGDEPSVSKYTTEKNITHVGKNAEVLTAPHCQKWIIPKSTQGLSTAGREHETESLSFVEAVPGGPAGYSGISSYRWHWMHIISFLTHPELLSVYHSTLAPLLSLFIPNAQPGAGKRCARIESLDTSSSHEDESAIAAEHIDEEAAQPTNQRPNGGTNSSCCGAGSWLVVRQVLCDLDDLRFLHDSSFAPCPQRQDPSFCALQQQQQMRLTSQSHQANSTVLSHSSPLLCCSAPKCSERCPGAFNCGTALLRSSILFGSFFEASQALAVWPQYLAAAAAAALPISSGPGQWNRSAFLTIDEKDEVCIPPSLESHRRESFTKEPGAPAASAQRRQWYCEQGTSGGSKVIGEDASYTRAELSDAARGVAACILKHVDLNKLDSTELLALLKLTEEAGSPSPLSPCEARHKVELDAGGSYSPGLMAAVASPLPDCNWSRAHVTPCTQSTVVDALTPSNSMAAFKRRRDDLDADMDSHEQTRLPRSLCSASVDPCPPTGGRSVEGKPIVCEVDVPCEKVRDETLAVSIHTVAGRASSAKRANRGPENAPARSPIADGIAILPEESRKTLPRFSPLFTPRQQQRRTPTLSAFDQKDTSKNRTKAKAVVLPQPRGQQQPVDSSLCPLNPASYDLCPVTSVEKPTQLAFASEVDQSACPERTEKDINSQGNLQPPGVGKRKTLLAFSKSTMLSEPALPQLADTAATCQPFPVSPLHDPFPVTTAPAAGAAEEPSYNEVVCRADCRPNHVQRAAGFASQDTVLELLENEQMVAPARERSAVPHAFGTKFLSLAKTVAPSQQTHSEPGAVPGANRLAAEGGNVKEKKGEGRKAESALDIIEHERALSLVAAGVRNTRKRFRLQSVRRKAQARLHFGVDCMTLCPNGSTWDENTLTHLSLESVFPKEQRALAALQSPRGLTSVGIEESQNPAVCRPSSSHLSGGIAAGGRRNGAGPTSAAVASSNFNNACNVRSPVKGIYYDSYKKLWRVQWNSSSGASRQSATTHVSVSTTGQGGAGRRVSRSFSCARLGFEAAKARAVAWMLSGGHVGDGGLAEGPQRPSPEYQANSNIPGNVASGVSGANRSIGKQKHELEKNSSGNLSKARQGAERQELAEREEKEKLLFANPKLFLERVEAFYVRNGLYGLQCGNGPMSGLTERHRSGNKELEEQQHGTVTSFTAASIAGNSRKGNGGTGGLRIVSVLSLDDMLDIVQGKKTTMSFPYGTLRHTSLESRGNKEQSATAFAAGYSHVCQGGQHHISRQQPSVQEDVPSHSQLHTRDLDSNGESAKKKSRTRVTGISLEMEGVGHRRLSVSSCVEQAQGADSAAEQTERTDDVGARLIRDAKECSHTESADRRALNGTLSASAAIKVADQREPLEFIDETKCQAYVVNPVEVTH